MGPRKVSKQTASLTSAAANPGVSLTAQSANHSSILKSSFAPHRLNANLFASVLQGLDSQHIRIHDTSSGRLSCDYATPANTIITCLDWGYFKNSSADSEARATKKRKRSSQTNGITSAIDIVLAYGTSQSEIHLLSPNASTVLKTLKDAHLGGIRDFKFQNDGLDHRAYSIGGEGKVVQWDLESQTAIMTTTLPNGPATAVRPTESKVICALHSAYIMDLPSMTWSNPYNVSTNNVHTLLIESASSKEHMQFITIAKSDRFMNVFNEESSVLNGSLRAENEIVAVDLCSLDGHSKDQQQEMITPTLQPKQALVILNKDGVLEVFPEPFAFDVDPSKRKSDSLKARMKQRSRKSVAQIRITRPGPKGAQVPLINVVFQKNEIAVAWVEGGLDVIFDTIQWRDAENGRVLLNGSVEIINDKGGTGLGAVNMNGVKDMGRSHVDESHTVVVNTADGDDISMEEADPEVIHISSAEEEDESEEDDESTKLPAPREDAENDFAQEEEESNLVDIGDESMPDVDREEKSEEKADAPSFGDLLRTNAPEAINVSDALTDGNAQSLVPANANSLRTLPSGMSLGTILTQSLRTNDVNLLETCLHTRDLATVRSTIERLDSTFATDLLQRLAERLHSRPGRAGSLMVWIQWTLVAHGGYLAGRPEVMQKLKSLHRVVRERAGSLQSLLSLKGKLDMLEAQMNLRRSVLEKGRRANMEDEDEGAVIYVEGQEDEDEGSDDDEDDSDDSGEPDAINMKRVVGVDADEHDESEGEADTQLVINGAPTDAEDASDSEDGMSGDEPSETDEDSEEELDNEDIDHASADSESSDGEVSPPPKQTRISNRVRY